MDVTIEGVRALVKEFIRRLESHGNDPRDPAESALECLSQLLWLAGVCELGTPRPTQAGAMTLYYDPGLHIVVGNMPEGTGVPSHAHATWEAIGVFSGDFEYTVHRDGALLAKDRIR